MRTKGTFLALSFCLFASSAMSESVFLVQLGSHTSPEAAEQTWQEIQKDAPEALAGLQHQKNEITLPPAGTKVVRLQAGPFNNRFEALKTCEQIRPTGQDCFVVETVMFNPEGPAAVASVMPQEPMEQPVTAVEPEPVDVQEADSEGTLVDNITASLFGSDEPEVPVAAPVAAVAAQAPVIMPKKQPVAQVSTEEIQQAVEAAVPEPTVEETPSPFPSYPVLSEIDVPQTVQESNERVVAAASQSADLPWLKLSNASNTIQTATPVEEPQVMAQMRAPQASSSYIPAPASQRTAVKSLPKPEERSTIASWLPWLKKDKVAQPVASDSPTQAAPMQQDGAAPFELANLDSNASGGEVVVAEAIQVPLSENQPPVMPQTQPSLFKGPNAPGWRAKPSHNMVEQAYWAQLYSFTSKQAAMRYWENLKRQLPEDAQKLRSRITNPYKLRYQQARISLQLGPFSSLDNVNRLCNIARQGSLQCVPRRVMGVTAVADAPRYRTEDRWENTRRAAKPSAPTSMAGAYWVQLGSYSSRGEASGAWQKMSSRFVELEGMQPHIDEPRLSSSPSKIYRLHSGPFATRYAAQYTCDQLRYGGQRCFVLRR